MFLCISKRRSKFLSHFILSSSSPVKQNWISVFPAPQYFIARVEK
jgi:hypothetical protein